VKDERLVRVTAICLALPEAVREYTSDHAIFRVRSKVFAYYLANHHGDGIFSVCAKTLPGDNTALVASNPSAFYLPAYIGPRGWAGLRLDAGEVDWEEVREFVTVSYLQTAPKRLASFVKIAD
jgi:predicted DNA-binding protein (MmcQ/YjbR family)